MTARRDGTLNPAVRAVIFDMDGVITDTASSDGKYYYYVPSISLAGHDNLCSNAGTSLGCGLHRLPIVLQDRALLARLDRLDEVTVQVEC